MKAFFIAALVALIATAASAQMSQTEVAPIVMKRSGPAVRETQNEPEIAILPIGMNSDAVAAAPNQDAEQMTVERPVEKSSTRLQVEAAAARPSGPRFICRGTDPFWVLRIEQQAISFDKAGEGLSQYSQPQAAPSENSALAVTNFISKNEKNEMISALVVDTQMTGGVRCTDGMQDQVYSHSVYVMRDLQVFDGCCWMER